MAGKGARMRLTRLTLTPAAADSGYRAVLDKALQLTQSQEYTLVAGKGARTRLTQLTLPPAAANGGFRVLYIYLFICIFNNLHSSWLLT